MTSRALGGADRRSSGAFPSWNSRVHTVDDAVISDCSASRRQKWLERLKQQMRVRMVDVEPDPLVGERLDSDDDLLSGRASRWPSP